MDSKRRHRLVLQELGAMMPVIDNDGAEGKRYLRERRLDFERAYCI